MGGRQINKPSRISGRAGFTLLELMLVLALLVVIGALALPVFRETLQSQRLLKAGELVRIEWCKARNRAMKTGQIQMFRYESDSNGYQIEPYLSEQDWLEADQETAQSLGLTNMGSASGMAAPQFATTELASGLASKPKQLPEGIVFAGGSIESSSRLLEIQQQMPGSAAMASQDTIPILFYPDGTSSDTQLILGNEQQLFVVVSLRGLTAVARVTDLMTHDELAQIQ